jgi:hypothetical protein
MIKTGCSRNQISFSHELVILKALKGRLTLSDEIHVRERLLFGGYTLLKKWNGHSVVSWLNNGALLYLNKSFN